MPVTPLPSLPSADQGGGLCEDVPELTAVHVIGHYWVSQTNDGIPATHQGRGPLGVDPGSVL
jgi:hypothetical protein